MKSTSWLVAAVCVIFSLHASAAESPASGEALFEKEEEAVGEGSQPTQHVIPREIPQQKEAFDVLANRLAGAGEKLREGRALKTMSTESMEERQTVPKQRLTKSFTDEDVEAKRKEAEKKMPGSLEEAKKHLFEMSGKKQAEEKQAEEKQTEEKQSSEESGGFGIFSYVALGIVVLGAVAGVVFFAWHFIANK